MNSGTVLTVENSIQFCAIQVAEGAQLTMVGDSSLGISSIGTVRSVPGLDMYLIYVEDKGGKGGNSAN